MKKDVYVYIAEAPFFLCNCVKVPEGENKEFCPPTYKRASHCLKDGNLCCKPNKENGMYKWVYS